MKYTIEIEQLEDGQYKARIRYHGSLGTVEIDPYSFLTGKATLTAVLNAVNEELTGK